MKLKTDKMTKLINRQNIESHTTYLEDPIYEFNSLTKWDSVCSLEQGFLQYVVHWKIYDLKIYQDPKNCKL